MLSILAKVRKAFTAIGTTNGTKFPEDWEPKGRMSNAEREQWFNQTQACYEYAIATELESLAKARREVSKTMMLKAGIVLDAEPGNPTVVFGNEHLVCTVKKNRDTDALDRTLLTNALRNKYSWTQAQVDELLKAASKPRAGATIVSVALSNG